MRITKLRELLREAPFRPFVLHLSNGSRYTVRHPDFISLGSEQVIVTDVTTGTQTQLVACCDPLHITHTELAAAAT